jgi:hypothetical protein
MMRNPASGRGSLSCFSRILVIILTYSLNRFDLDSQLTAILESLNTPGRISISVERPLAATVTRGAASDGLIR